MDYNLRNPVVSQGSSGTLENHQGPAILETIIEDTCPSGSSFEKKVLHIPYDYFITEPPSTEIIHSGANLVQLSRRPFVSIQNDWWQNLRLMQIDTSIAEFCTSTRMFWRKQTDDLKPYVFFGYCDTSGASTLTNISLDGNPIKWSLKKIFPELDPTNRYIFLPFVRRDTFYTEWFSPRDVSTLNLILNRTSNASLNVSIQRKSDGRTLLLPASLEPAPKVRNLVFQLLNRTPDEKYRLVIFKNNPATDFCQQIILMPEILDEILPRVGVTQSETAVDLGSMGLNENISDDIQILAFPNPANDAVYIVTYLPVKCLKRNTKNDKKVRMHIFNALGEKKFEAEAVSGEPVFVSTLDWSNGIYYIIATGIFDINDASGSTTFIICK